MLPKRLAAVAVFLLGHSATTKADTPASPGCSGPTTHTRGKECFIDTFYCVKGHDTYWTAPALFTGVEIGPDPSGGSISAGYSYTKTTSVTWPNAAGTFDFGEVSSIFAAGGLNLGANYAVSTGETTAVSGVQACPPNMKCGLTASAKLLRVTGEYHTQYLGSCPGERDTTVSFTAIYPVEVAGGSKGKSNLVADFSACSIGKDVKGMERCPGTDPSDTTATKPRPPNTHDSGGFVPFPGAAWFKTKPNSPIIDAMGKRLVEEGCKAYKVGPGPQWTGADQDSYKLWQQKLRFKGANADGWPGQVSWDKLKVPN